jgi:hypothetical protein
MRIHVRSWRDSIGIGVTGGALIIYFIFVANDPISEDANQYFLKALLFVGLALGASMIVRAARLGVRVERSDVIVYNFFRTHRIPRREVVRFVVGRLRFIDRDAAVLERAGGQKIVVSSLSLSPYEVARGSDRVVRFVQQLNAALELP